MMTWLHPYLFPSQRWLLLFGVSGYGSSCQACLFFFETSSCSDDDVRERKGLISGKSKGGNISASKNKQEAIWENERKISCQNWASQRRNSIPTSISSSLLQTRVLLTLWTCVAPFLLPAVAGYILSLIWDKLGLFTWWHHYSSVVHLIAVSKWSHFFRQAFLGDINNLSEHKGANCLVGNYK